MNATLTSAAERTDLLPASMSVAAIVLLVVVGMLLWAAIRYLTTRHRERLPTYGVVAPRVLIAIGAIWCALQLLARWCELTGPWPVWLAAIIAGVLVEGTAALYRREREVISPRLGMILIVLRGLALLLLVFVLLQPVRVWTADRSIARRVVVLLDDSESMNFTDRQWTTSEMVELGMQAEIIEPGDRLLPSLNALSAWPVAGKHWPAMLTSTNRLPELRTALKDTASEARKLQGEVDVIMKSSQDAGDHKVVNTLRRVQSHLQDDLVPGLVEAEEKAGDGSLSSRRLRRVIRSANRAASMVNATRLAVDGVAWKSLPNARREEVSTYATTTRVAIARSVLTRAPEDGESLLDRLSSRYDVSLMRMGNGLKPTSADAIKGKTKIKLASSAEETSFRALTDYSTVLEKILDDTPSEELAGVLMLSDGRNNGRASLDPVGQRYGLQGVPICGVVVGGSRVPRDVAIADVEAPESVFLGDKVRVNVTVRVTGARGNSVRFTMSGTPDGETVTNALIGGEMVLDEEQIDVFTDNYTRELRMTHEPKSHGIRTYTLRADVLDGELFTTNNTWQVDVAVSDDRTNVLLVDGKPRWEFRYLRNLFFGRDKSVHLQYLLEEPDRAGGVTLNPLPPASASRKFGDAESGSLPVSRDEWRMFDMIILGDVSARMLTPEVLADIRHCVTERGAALVVIAGMHHMPRTYDEEMLREMLPVDYKMQLGEARNLVRLESRLKMTAAGKAHPVMQQSDSYSENEVIWDEMQELSWRFPVLEVKPGADVLAYAEPIGKGVLASDNESVDVSSAGEQLDEETLERARNSLVVVQNYGRGKIMMLNFDQTWRLRYKIGDTYHHRLWGQVMRWGVGEKLRAGEDHLRLGTDKLTYTPGQTPRVLARVTASNFVGVTDAELDVSVSHGGKEVARVKPAYREDSHGMYEVPIPPCTEPGRYEVVLKRTDRGRKDTVETAFMVVMAERSVELGDVTATREDLGLLARLSGGQVFGPDRAGELWDGFGEGRKSVLERHERTLWDRPWILFLLLGLLTTEWVLRKRGGLT